MRIRAEVSWKSVQVQNSTEIEWPSTQCHKTKTKIISVTGHKGTESPVNQSKLEVNTCNRGEARENERAGKRVGVSDGFDFKLKACGKQIQLLSLSLGDKRFYVTFKKVTAKSRRPFKMHVRASSWCSKAKALSNNFNTAVTKKNLEQQKPSKQTSGKQENQQTKKQTRNETKRKLTDKGKIKKQSRFDSVM